MCHVVYHIYDDCQHEKKTEIIERCEDFDRGCRIIPVHLVEITAPSLCVRCFREVEARIDAEYEFNREHLRRRIIEYESNQEDRQIRGRAQGTNDEYVAELELRLLVWKRVRDRQIKEFREKQGVWADG